MYSHHAFLLLDSRQLIKLCHPLATKFGGSLGPYVIKAVLALLGPLYDQTPPIKVSPRYRVHGHLGLLLGDKLQECKAPAGSCSLLRAQERTVKLSEQRILLQQAVPKAMTLQLQLAEQSSMDRGEASSLEQSLTSTTTKPHLGVPSNLRGSLQVLIWPKGLNSDMTSLRVASKAMFRTMILVLCLAASSLEAFWDGLLEALCLLSWSTS